jgi:cytochrome c oxidase accessory protein FixG
MSEKTPKAVPADAGATVDLYEIQRTIHPRAVHGWFASWRIALVLLTQLVFYGTLWLNWNGRQAVLFDLASRKFYIFGLVFWPQDFIFLTTLLVISAVSLFLFTAIAGRLWCGYACPQTVYTEIFLWIERRIEGDRMARIKLDAQPMNARKFGLRALKHGIWIALSLWTGFTFVGYFSPARELFGEAVRVKFGPWEAFWIFFYGLATYGNAGWMREQVCKYMCPYARFQSVMFDHDTLIITYDEKRGEPRGSRGRGVDSRKAGKGDCVDCGICVQVCPTGIDIRHGLQYECIGCAACIDGCDQVMDKMGSPRGLIRYTTSNAVHGVYPDQQILKRVMRPRTMIYGAVLLSLITAFTVLLFLRVPLKVDVIRDRGAMVRETAEGRLENVYRLQVMNTSEVTRKLVISAAGIDGMEVVVKQPVEVPVASTTMVPVTVRVDPASTTPGSHPVRFTVRDAEDERIKVVEKSVFYVR